MAASSITFQFKGFPAEQQTQVEKSLKTFMESTSAKSLVERVSSHAQTILLEVVAELDPHRFLLRHQQQPPALQFPSLHSFGNYAARGTELSEDEVGIVNALPVIAALVKVERIIDSLELIKAECAKGNDERTIMEPWLAIQHSVGEKTEELVKAYVDERAKAGDKLSEGFVERTPSATRSSANKLDARPDTCDLKWLNTQIAEAKQSKATCALQ